LNTHLKQVLGNRTEELPVAIENEGIDAEIEFNPYVDEEEQKLVPEADDIDYNEFHNFISSHVSIPVWGKLQRGKV
jgi:hypothetical protein